MEVCAFDLKNAQEEDEYADIKNGSIEELRFAHTYFYDGSWKQFAYMIPNLRSIMFKECTWMPRRNGYGDMATKIKLPGAILRNLTWLHEGNQLFRNDPLSERNKVFLKISDAISETYLLVTRYQTVTSSRSAFREAAKDGFHLCIEIECEYIQMFVLEYINFQKVVCVHDIEYSNRYPTGDKVVPH